jgi:arylsulfatase
MGWHRAPCFYIEGLDFQAVRWNQWKFMFTAKDAWLGPEMNLGGLPAVYNLQMDPANSTTCSSTAPPLGWPAR